MRMLYVFARRAMASNSSFCSPILSFMTLLSLSSNFHDVGADEVTDYLRRANTSAVPFLKCLVISLIEIEGVFHYGVIFRFSRHWRVSSSQAIAVQDRRANGI